MNLCPVAWLAITSDCGQAHDTTVAQLQAVVCTRWTGGFNVVHLVLVGCKRGKQGYETIQHNSA
jgi:hypothetical protein